MNNELFLEMEEYAKENKIPIMQKEGIADLLDVIKNQKVTRILEVGTAIGYSALKFNELLEVPIVTIEYDEQRALKAHEYIKQAGKQDEIEVIINDALAVDASALGKFEIIFIDAAKAKYKKYFEYYMDNLQEGGIIIFDNINFHGFVGHSHDKELIRTRRLRTMIRRLEQFNEFILNHEEWEATKYESGDGFIICKKRGK